jgi:predicted metalloendopeptidase
MAKKEAFFSFSEPFRPNEIVFSGPIPATDGTSSTRVVLRLAADGITVPDGVLVDDAAKTVLAALERHIATMLNAHTTRLAAENERLRAALERIAFGKYHWEADAQEEARAALKEPRT